jgi:uncharacterized iron-regulated protein
MIRRYSWLLLLVLLAACETQKFEWQNRLGREHKLIGGIWDPTARHFITEEDLIKRLAAADFVMLGEKHDNADHHRLQAHMLRALADAGRRPVVGFEMLTTDQAPALAEHLKSRPEDAAGLGGAVAWEKSGWPRWKIYQPVAEAALDNGFGLVATGLPRPTVMAVGRNGVSALDAGQVARVGLDRPLDPLVEAAMRDELRISHCDKLPPETLPAMVLVQRARDGIMADNLVRAADTDGAVLITGAGHARRDRGVPSYIARLRPQASRFALAFIEVERKLDTPRAYAGSYGASALPFDAVVFTPRVDNDDPCKNIK